MRRIFVPFVLASALCVAYAHAAELSKSGLYDSVQISSVTGDEGGIRIRVNDGPSPTVDFTLCEGACHDLQRFPAKIEGDKLSFVYVEQLTDVQGRPTRQNRARVEGRFVAEGLMLKIDFLDSPHDDNAAFSLIPRAKPRS